MIKLKRPSKPKVLADHGAEWLKELKTSTGKKAKALQKKYQHQDIRKSLLKMTHDKCAFCESKITHAGYPHVEHFRPKSLPQFSELIFDWDNLLIACTVCNTGNKRTRFPLDAQGKPLLIDPCTEDPSTDLVFDVHGRVIGKTPKGKKTVEILGLNRKELWEYRCIFVDKIKKIKAMAEKGNVEAQQIMIEAADDSSEFSAFAKELM